MPTKGQFLEDLAIFSDLGTSPTVVEDVAAHIRVEWTRHDVIREVELQNPASAFEALSVEGEPGISYADFLASPVMGDLERLATKIRALRRVRRNRKSRTLTSGQKVYPMSWYVDPRFGSMPGPHGGEESAQDRLQAFADTTAESSTELLFVMAEAGQGKSSVLEEFTVNQAQRYLQGDTTTLSLYIDAQGRGLARLDEVISKQLNELDFLLSYNALVTLVREGLVVLVIDGFDELIGSRGTFDDAFRSLSTFLEILDGRGSIIAAGRSTYFVQEYDTRGQLLSDSLRYTLEQVFLKPWTQTDQDQFVEIALDSVKLPERQKDEVRSRFYEFHMDSHLRDLLTRPLFARDVLYILLDGGRKPTDLTGEKLIPYLAHEYLTREVEDKFLADDVSFLEADQLKEYYQHLAEEMWNLETRELDVTDAELVIDLCAEESWNLIGQGREMARARAGKLPFLAVGENSRRVEFEHEVFFGYFLASSLVPALRGGSSAVGMLGRARLDEMTADMVLQMSSQEGQRSSQQDLQAMLDTLSELARTRHPRRLQIRMNAGILAAALLRRASKTSRGSGLRIKGMPIAGESLSGVSLNDCQFQSVRLDNVDLRGAQFVDCRGDDLVLDAVLIDPLTTRLDISGLEPSTDVLGLQFEEGGLLDLTYDPERIAELLNLVGALKGESSGVRFEVRPAVLERLERIARAFRKMVSIGTNHTRFGSLFTDDLGSEVVCVLLTNELIEVDEPKQTRGPAQTFYRKRFDEAELLGALSSPAADATIERAWRDLAAL